MYRANPRTAVRKSYVQWEQRQVIRVHMSGITIQTNQPDGTFSLFGHEGCKKRIYNVEFLKIIDDQTSKQRDPKTPAINCLYSTIFHFWKCEKMISGSPEQNSSTKFLLTANTGSKIKHLKRYKTCAPFCQNEQNGAEHLATCTSNTLVHFFLSSMTTLPSIAIALVAILVSLRVLRLIWQFLTGDCDLRTISAQVDSAKFRDKTIWVTGASSGIGLHLARLLANHGARLVLSGRDQKGLDHAVESLMCDPSKISTVLLDLDVPSDELFARVKSIVTNSGGIDILFNNAGISSRADSVNMDLSVLDRLIRVNFVAPVILARACMPKVSIIVNTLSIAAMVHTPLRAPYSSTKSALASFSKCMQLEHDSVKVFNVYPGSTRTSIAVNALMNDGTPFLRRDANIEAGLEPYRVADRILAAVSQDILNPIIAPNKELIAVRIAQWFPSLWHFIATRRAASYKNRILNSAPA